MNKSVSRSIEKSIKSSLGLLSQRNPKILLGVSGGPDSMALLYAFFKSNVDVMVVHINYELRGKESDIDQELVEGMCTEWGFECCSIRLNNNIHQGNFQNWAREERYRIFKELKEAKKISCIATAHHQNDQVETILQKVLRGSGVEAWQGMSIWDGQLFRPLLPFKKSEIVEYCSEEAIPYRIDESNLESGYARNFIRNELSADFNKFFPGWQTNILALQEKGEVTELAIHHIIEFICVGEEIELSKFSQLNEKLKPAVLKKFISIKYPELKISKGKLIELLKIEDAQSGTSIEISDSIHIVRDRASITLKNEQSKTIELEISELDVNNGINFKNLEISISKSINNEIPLYIDAGLIKWPLTIRVWKKGDKIVPLGMNGSQKISDHLTNRKITSSKREKALILSDVDSTIYAIIFPVKAENGEIGTVSEIIKCTEQTTEYLTINPK
tara:strand:- start:28071 stop:29408 length:1338 start_codon:yes stop_codon:yes gene_type:complete